MRIPASTWPNIVQSSTLPAVSTRSSDGCGRGRISVVGLLQDRPPPAPDPTLPPPTDKTLRAKEICGQPIQLWTTRRGTPEFNATNAHRQIRRTRRRLWAGRAVRGTIVGLGTEGTGQPRNRDPRVAGPPPCPRAPFPPPPPNPR